MRRVRVILTPRARVEARDAYSWYTRLDVSVGESFQGEFRGAIRTVRDAPERWAMWRPPHRRMLFERFPYQLIYRCLDEARVLVVAVRHQQRNPDEPLDE